MAYKTNTLTVYTVHDVVQSVDDNPMQPLNRPMRSSQIMGYQKVHVWATCCFGF